MDLGWLIRSELCLPLRDTKLLYGDQKQKSKGDLADVGSHEELRRVYAAFRIGALEGILRRSQAVIFYICLRRHQHPQSVNAQSRPKRDIQQREKRHHQGQRTPPALPLQQPETSD